MGHSSNIALRDFPEMESLFLRGIAPCQSPEDAIVSAGYSGPRPDRQAYAWLEVPRVQAALRYEIMRQLSRDATRSFRVLRELRDDPEISAKVRVDASKALLDRSGFGPVKTQDIDTKRDKPLHELTVGELREQADRLEAEIAGRAKPIISADLAPMAIEAIDLIG